MLLLVWAVVYNAISMVFGYFITKTFGLPNWVTPALAFNNTTSLPLLLVQSLKATNILSTLLMSSNDTASAAVERAESYFLVNAMVSNTLTFALGPKLLNGQEEDAPDEQKEEDEDSDDDGSRDGEPADDVERGSSGNAEDAEEPANEQTSLLPDSVVKPSKRASRKGYKHFLGHFKKLPPAAQEFLDIAYQFLNAPLAGAAIGAFIGLIPPLHRAFFASSFSGGIFNAWLTTSIKNIGDLFAALQVIVVGVKLGASMRALKAGEPSGEVPWLPVVIVTFMRFLVWPAVSIGFMYFLAAKTTWLGNDPILWFSLMLMPTGPPALKLTALADVNGSDQQQKLAIAKFLSVRRVWCSRCVFTVF